MRLFAALPPPPHVLDALARAVRPLRERPGGGELRWTAPEGWHLTLAFYGEVPADTGEDLRTRLARAAGHTPPLRLALRGGGRFGDRVLWARVDGDLAGLRLLADRTRAAGRRAGLDLGERQGYRPHVSLARCRGGLDLAPYAAALDAFDGGGWSAGELALVRSHLPRSGVPGEQPRYEQVGAWPLTGAG